MERSSRALHHTSISFSNYRLKTEKYSIRMKIDQSAMCYISMDLIRQALQTNRKRYFYFIFIFLNFGIIFLNELHFLK